MTTEHLKQNLTGITYKDETDIVALRYWVLNVLAHSAEEYKKAAGTSYAFSLLQEHKKLEAAHLEIKEKSRRNDAGHEDFVNAKFAALKCLQNFTVAATYVTAA